MAQQAAEIINARTETTLVSVNMINVTKLSPLNYITWSAQVKSLLRGYDLLKFIDPTTVPPPKVLTNNGRDEPNPNFLLWQRQDSLLYSSLMGSIETAHQPLIATAASSLEAWNLLASTYAKSTRGHIKQLKQQLKQSTKGTKSIDEYMQQIRAKADGLALLGSAMDPEDLTDIVLDGLNDDYKAIIEAIHGRETPISFAELHEKLINRELAVTAATNASPSLPITANVAQQRPTNWRQNHGGNHQGSRNNNNRDQRSSRPYLGRCQACGTQGHGVKRCPMFRLVTQSPQANVSGFQGQNRGHYPQAYNAMMQAPDTASWLLDSGASHHLTSDLANLSLHAPYNGGEEVQIGNGTGLAIQNTGSSLLPSNSRTLFLNNVLHVPDIARNLLSVNKLCTDNNVSVEFFPTKFQVKDLKSGAQMIKGNSRDGGYVWPGRDLPKPIAFSTSFKCPLSIWHSRLGHPSISVLKSVVSSSMLSNSNALSSFHCDACSINKSHKLPFSQTSSLLATKPLEIVYSDVWTSPLISVDGFKYYVIFVDQFTHYIWFYPLRHKSDVKSIFIRWKALVETRFQHKLISFYSDNGGEYIALADFFSTNGISHLTTPPHTPEHNGFSERRHRHIVETGLALLSQASIPASYWTYAMATAVYLINRQPTPTLANTSAYAKLFGFKPNYLKLRSFGCLCYPWIKPYNRHKLEPKSKPCIFLGYSLHQSAFLCLEPSSSRIFVSRHVHFVETEFPFLKLTSLPTKLKPTSPNWCPPVTLISVPPQSPPSPPVPPGMNPTDLETNTSVSNALSADVNIEQGTTSASAAPVSATTFTSQQPAAVANNRHRMTTRAKNKIFKPSKKFSYVVNKKTLLPSENEPATLAQALKDELWRGSMSEEFDSQVRNHTWSLVPYNPKQNLVGCRWVHRIKRRANGTIERRKSRLVAKGYHQRPGVDYQDTYSPVIKQPTVLLILGHAVSKNWPLRQLDVNNAFLQGHLTETVYMEQPPGFVDKDKPTHVCKLHKAIYGLKQAPRIWYLELRTFLLQLGFKNSLADASLFILHLNGTTLYVLIYVDDIIVTGNNSLHVQNFITNLSRRFSLKDLGALSYFLGIEAHRTSSGLLLTQRKYINDILNRVNMSTANPASSPMVTSDRLQLTSGTPLLDGSEYRMVVGSLQYLHFTRPDIAFAVNKLSQFMHRPTDLHWLAVKRVLRYLAGTRDRGIFLRSNNTPSLHAFSVSDWAGNRDDYTSTGAYIVYLGANPILWSSKKQKTVARSSTEAEYRCVADTAAELQWIVSLMRELDIKTLSQPVIYCDNVGATYLCHNPVFHSRMKHVALDYHFIRELIQSGLLRVSHVSSKDQLADALTKPVSRSLLEAHSSKMGLSSGRSS